ncbi:VWA domain-containing protein [Planctomicrobium sp. SH664]|uniref:VWA domain-containing protein n=1 Tax=Planctomicrobium sp. SH664 TaxID=3448125 RepID=UPI003F5C145E
MPMFEFSRWDGSQSFSPQSADQIFDKLSEYLLQYGDEVMPNLENWEQEHPDVVDMLIKRGLVEKDREGKYHVTPKGLKRVENKAIESLFNTQQRDKLGRHDTEHRGVGQTVLDESKPYEFGDPVSNLNLHDTLKNALHRQGGGSPIQIQEEDLVLYDTEYQTSCATVVLVDMSGSMTRYGKYGAAKRVALALQGLVRSRYQSDFLQVIGFSTFATPMTERELLNSAPKPVSIYDSHVRMRISLDSPPAFVPEHFTNIHAGLQYARRVLRRQPAANRQIILITDGEPTAHVEGRDVVLIYPPAEKTARLTLSEARRCANEGIQISSFALIEDYFYLGLVNFVEQLAQVTRGISATCNADDMGNLVVQSFVKGRRKRTRA